MVLFSHHTPCGSKSQQKNLTTNEWLSLHLSSQSTRSSPRLSGCRRSVWPNLVRGRGLDLGGQRVAAPPVPDETGRQGGRLSGSRWILQQAELLELLVVPSATRRGAARRLCLWVTRGAAVVVAPQEFEDFHDLVNFFFRHAHEKKSSSVLRCSVDQPIASRMPASGFRNTFSNWTVRSM